MGWNWRQTVQNVTNDFGHASTALGDGLMDSGTKLGTDIGVMNEKYINAIGSGISNSVNAVLNTGYMQSVMNKLNGGSDPGTPTTTTTPKTQTPTQAPTVSTTPQTSTAATYGTGQSGGANTIGQTLLTGPGGVDPNQLTLGRTTLLGNGGGVNNG